METHPRGSSVCVPKAEVQSRLDPREAYVCVCVSWKNGSLPKIQKAICFTSETSLCHRHKEFESVVQVNACRCRDLFGPHLGNNAL